jgi:hypothetical protein
MAKMTKAQCRKRLDEASKKISAVMMSDHTRMLTDAKRKEIYALAGQVARLRKNYE